ncbi:MAG: BrnA antitoxin family protein [Alphaproteobacteria bacterium]
MTANKFTTDPDWNDPDDAPDLSAPEWQARFAKVHVKRGRPKAEAPKVSTTIRLDADIVAYFRAAGPGWQSRINDALRRLVATERDG